MSFSRSVVGGVLDGGTAAFLRGWHKVTLWTPGGLSTTTVSSGAPEEPETVFSRDSSCVQWRGSVKCERRMQGEEFGLQPREADI